MKKAKLISVILVIIMVCSLISACGGSKNDPAPAASSAPPAASSEPAASTAPSEPEFTLIFVSDRPENVGMGTCEKAGFAYIEEKSNGRIKIQPYWSGTFLDSGDILSGVSDGMADICLNLIGQTSGVQPVGDILSQRHFMEMPDMDGRTEIYRQALAQIPEVQDELAKHNMRMIDLCSTPGSVMAFTDDFASKVMKPEDLRGKVVQSSGYYTNALQSIGVSGLVMPPSEWYTNFERGIVDVMGMNWPGNRDFGLVELAKSYITFGNSGTYSSSGQSYNINLDTWNSLPPDLQKIVVDGFRLTNDLLVERDMVFQHEVMDYEINTEGKLLQHIPQENMQPWYDIALLAVDLWKEDVIKNGYDGERIFADYQRIIDEYLASH